VQCSSLCKGPNSRLRLTSLLNFADLDTIGKRLGAFLFEPREAADFESEMIERARQAEAAIDQTVKQIRGHLDVVVADAGRGAFLTNH
jgi:hypothetical protein